MKKIIFLAFLQVLFSAHAIFAQEISKENKAHIDTIAKKMCECLNPLFKDFSPEFHKTFIKMAKILRKNKDKPTSLKLVLDYFQKNQAEYEKFVTVVTKANENENEECDIDLDVFEDDKWIEKYYVESVKKMAKVKKCDVGYVIFMMSFAEKSAKK